MKQRPKQLTFISSVLLRITIYLPLFYNNSSEVIKKETLLVNNDSTNKVYYMNNLSKFQNHPSIMKKKSKCKFQEKVYFKQVPVKYEENIIKIFLTIKRLDEKYLCIFLNNPVLLNKC